MDVVLIDFINGEKFAKSAQIFLKQILATRLLNRSHTLFIVLVLTKPKTPVQPAKPDYVCQLHGFRAWMGQEINI